MEYQDIIERAEKAMGNAYAPYSEYHVGACVRCSDGSYFIGANIENASYGATNCGERSAIFAAYSHGYRKDDIVALAIVSDGDRIAAPCGICRQVLSELLNQDTPIVSQQRQGYSNQDNKGTAANAVRFGGPALKSGFVAIIGRPNAGKSTLLNAIIESKISIISPKAQTTRNAIRGILTDEDSQIVFVDTPGIHKPQHSLGEQMNKEAISNMSGVDLIYYIVDGSQEFGAGEEYIIKLIKNTKLPVFLILNKIDQLSRDEVMDKLIQYSRKADFKEIIPISALENDNLDELLKTTKEYLEDGIQYYPSDQVCDYPETVHHFRTDQGKGSPAYQ